MINPSPVVYEATAKEAGRTEEERQLEVRDDVADPIDAQEIYDLIRGIQDPEHPLTLEQLQVVQKAHIDISDLESKIRVDFTPTIPHCSMATLIGLCIRVKLMRSLPPRFKVDIYVRQGSHQQEKAVNKQLNDKERVAAALENGQLATMVNHCLLANRY